MNSNDLLCVGAKPLWFLDYYSQNRLDLAAFRGVLAGMRKALGVLGAQLAGGETAELPGAFKDPRGYELAGFLAGTCDPGWDLGAHRVRPGDVLVGISSTGPHANGFALIRKLLGPAQIRRQAEALLAPTRLYHPYVWPLLKDSALARGLHAMAHVTGGGFFEKLPRALGAPARAELHWGSWKIPPVLITPHGPYRKARTVGTSGTECCGTAGTIGTIGTLGTGVAEVGDEGLNGTFGRTGTERNGGTIGTARRAE